MGIAITIDGELVAEAHELGIDVSEAADQGLREAVRRRRAELDREAYQAHPEPDDDWHESWGEREDAAKFSP